MEHLSKGKYEREREEDSLLELASEREGEIEIETRERERELDRPWECHYFSSTPLRCNAHVFLLVFGERRFELFSDHIEAVWVPS